MPKLEAPFRHSILCTTKPSLTCSSFGIDPASNSSEVPQRLISREKYLRLLNPLLSWTMILPPTVPSLRKSKLGIAPRISTSSGLTQMIVSFSTPRFPCEPIQFGTL
uniref:Uncharacterized protein n=1 Tax=Arundo donax TaxID=35708 RepID=A0A0A9GSK5_ARUDO